jgi:hypothetical protein
LGRECWQWVGFGRRLGLWLRLGFRFDRLCWDGWIWSRTVVEEGVFPCVKDMYCLSRVRHCVDVNCHASDCKRWTVYCGNGHELTPF